MCNTSYTLYWWEFEPYVENHADGHLNLTGIIFDTADELFKVVLMASALSITFFISLFTLKAKIYKRHSQQVYNYVRQYNKMD